MIKCIKLLTNIDFLSPEIGFEYNGSSHYKSIAGGVYSLIILILNIVITIMFSSSLYLRDDPNVISYEEQQESSTIYLNNFPMTMSFSDNTGLNDAYRDLFDIDMVSFTLNKNLTFNRIVYNDIFKKCEKDQFSMLNPNIIKDYYNDFNTEGIFCLKSFENLFFRNEFGVSDSTFINIRVAYCDQKTNPKCPNNIKEILTAITVGFQYPTSYTNPQNFESPVKYKVNNYSLGMSIGILKRLFLNIANNIYYSDDDWMFSSNIRQINHMTYQSSSLDISFTSTNMIYYITLSSPKLSNIIKRKYIKIPDLLSNIGGFSSIIFIVFNFITKSHLRFNYLTFIRNLALEDDKSIQNVLSLNESPLKKTINSKGTFNIKSEPQIKRLNSDQNGNKKEKVKENNFTKEIDRKKSIDNHLLSEITPNYFYYVFNIIFCNRLNVEEYNIVLENTKKLISISAFSKLMAFQFNKYDDSIRNK